ncbi:hypothetical protein [Ferrimonas sp. YFM]|uniref:oxidoreductase n=1 Tax=Ferrimonas sp. YFM TaxID=3028878 RepID=UPI0025747FDF|nr:hypothetical protein [Ferrimonas sp. YFM]BDY04457.1 hypothetical protein F0521_14980 [Ferrimonas sp. YFM]
MVQGFTQVAANGYLLDQFLLWDTKGHKDQWGGSEENMAHILLEVLDAVTQVGLRLSPVGYLHLEHDERGRAVFDYLLPKLNHYPFAYVHTGMLEDTPYPHLGGTVTQYIRRLYDGTVIACGGYDTDSGRQVLQQGDADLIAIVRPLFANPDCIEKVRSNQSLTSYSADMLDTLI